MRALSATSNLHEMSGKRILYRDRLIVYKRKSPKLGMLHHVINLPVARYLRGDLINGSGRHSHCHPCAIPEVQLYHIVMGLALI